MSTKNTKVKKVGEKRPPNELTKEAALAEDNGAKTDVQIQDGASMKEPEKSTEV